MRVEKFINSRFSQLEIVFCFRLDETALAAFDEGTVLGRATGKKCR